MADLIAEPRPQRPLQGLLQQAVIGARSDRRERVKLNLGGAETTRELDRALAPGDRLLPARRAQAVDRQIGVRPGELGARREALE